MFTGTPWSTYQSVASSDLPQAQGVVVKPAVIWARLALLAWCLVARLPMTRFPGMAHRAGRRRSRKGKCEKSLRSMHGPRFEKKNSSNKLDKDRPNFSHSPSVHLIYAGTTACQPRRTPFLLLSRRPPKTLVDAFKSREHGCGGAVQSASAPLSRCSRKKPSLSVHDLRCESGTWWRGPR